MTDVYVFFVARAFRLSLLSIRFDCIDLFSTLRVGLSALLWCYEWGKLAEELLVEQATWTLLTRGGG